MIAASANCPTESMIPMNEISSTSLQPDLEVEATQAPPPSGARHVSATKTMPSPRDSTPTPFPTAPTSRPPLVAPPSGSSPRAASKPPTNFEIPAVKPTPASTLASKAAAASKPAARLMGIEALQKRLENEQKARHKAEEQNMMMRLELNESRKEIIKLKREIVQLERDNARLSRPQKLSSPQK